MNPIKKLQYWLFFFMAASLEGGFALVALLSIPGDPVNTFFLGLSRSRFVMALVLFVLTLLFLGLGIAVGILPRWREGRLNPEIFPKNII